MSQQRSPMNGNEGGGGRFTGGVGGGGGGIGNKGVGPLKHLNTPKKPFRMEVVDF